MPRFPYTNFPFPFYRGYFKKPFQAYNFSKPNLNNTSYYNKNAFANIHGNSSMPPENSNLSCESDRNETHTNFKQKNKSNNNTDDYLFDLFGLKIYNDDILLVSLIYFLYSEGVKDDSLFIVLILLLLS